MKLLHSPSLGSIIFTLLSWAYGVAPAPLHALEPGTRGPDFILASLNADLVALEDFSGNVVLLDFWASWCHTCRRSLPWLNELQKKYGARGLRVVTINLDTDYREALNALASVDPAFTVLLDPDGEIPERYKLLRMPTSFIMDGSGTVVSTHEGFDSDDQQEIEAILGTLLPEEQS